jgi:hypothetical protein
MVLSFDHVWALDTKLCHYLKVFAEVEMNFLFALLISIAGAMTVPPEIGPHEKLFVIKKSENPQNIMMVYTKVDSQCRFVLQNSQPVLDIYWLMDREHYKAVHVLLRAEIRKRLNYSFENLTPHSFSLRVEGMKWLQPELPEVPLHVVANKYGHECDVDTFITFDNGEKISLESVNVVSEKILWPPFRKLISVTFQGLGADGKTVRRAFTVKD